MVGADRQIIASKTSDSLRSKADGRPLDIVFMSADAANQTQHAMPSLYPPSHGGERWVFLAVRGGFSNDVHGNDRVEDSGLKTVVRSN